MLSIVIWYQDLTIIVDFLRIKFCGPTLLLYLQVLSLNEMEEYTWPLNPMLHWNLFEWIYSCQLFFEEEQIQFHQTPETKVNMDMYTIQFVKERSVFKLWFWYFFLNKCSLTCLSPNGKSAKSWMLSFGTHFTPILLGVSFTYAFWHVQASN